ncbi:HAD-IC family P-type ATPase [Desulfothermobacter acidiphilus]|uniref:cation-translocating P-type ATPase n=1 Tax=Desulfothermobacter acidiphilus TaxID=1938353 RepID=UPI003F8A10DE
MSEVAVRHRIPGRMRLHLSPLQRGHVSPSHLKSYLEEIAGIKRVETNPATGNLLVVYDFRRLREVEVLKRIESTLRTLPPPLEAEVTPRAPRLPSREVFRFALATLFFGGVALKRLLSPRPSRPRSPVVNNLSAMVGVLSNFPALRRRLDRLGEEWGININLILSLSSAVLLGLRQSLPGALLMFLSQGLNLAEKLVLEDPLRGKASEEALTPYPEINQYIERTTNLALGVGTANYLWRRDLRQSLAIMAAVSPRPLALSESALVASALHRLAERGITCRHRHHFLSLPRVDTVIWCQSDLIKNGRPAIEEVFSLDSAFSSEEILALAAALYQKASHPLGLSLRQTLAEKNRRLPSVGPVERVGQHGLKAAWEESQVIVGPPSSLRHLHLNVEAGKFRARRYLQTGRWPIYVVVDDRLVGVLAVRESISAPMLKAIQALREQGVLHHVILSYGALEEIRVLENETGVDRVFPVTTAEDKKRIIELFRSQGSLVLAVGSGEDDEPALRAAAVGAAWGQRVSGADLVLAEPDPQLLPRLFYLSRLVQALHQQNFLLTKAFHVTGLGLVLNRTFDPSRAMEWQHLLRLLLLANTGRLNAYAEIILNPQVPPRRDNRATTRKPSPEWMNQPLADLLARLETDPEKGLNQKEARQRLRIYGPNSLLEVPPPSFWQRIKEQLQNQMVQLLMGTSMLNVLLGKLRDAFTIMAIVSLNALLGAFQESKADETLRALRELEVPHTRVIREGQMQEIPASQLVPGDVVLLRSGDRVPADARLLDSNQLEVDESSLTGESFPASKSHLANDRSGALFLGTSITRGRGRAVICATGMATEMGHIASMLGYRELGPSTFQHSLNQLGQRLLQLSLLACGLVVAVGMWRGEGLMNMVLTGTSLAVAAIPEGLPAIATISLAAGAQRMARRGVIVRHVGAVETLGRVNLICTDKTGTLTQNHMSVRRICVEECQWTVDEEGRLHGPQDYSSWAGLTLALKTAVLCNEACTLNNGETMASDDPTEVALLVAATRAGIDPIELRRVCPARQTIPFESSRRFMLVVCEDPEEECARVFAKGAPETILERSAFYWDRDQEQPLSPERKAFFLQQVQTMAASSLRVLAVAYKRCSFPIPTSSKAQLEEFLSNQLVFVGLIGMYDPPRPEARVVLDKCRRAGIEVKMITGDHPNTARAIATEIGLLRPGERVITGQELDELSEEELAQVAATARIFAQVLPWHKYELVRVFRKMGYVVAMTGDGVNDAPAVKAADVGIAMGKNGADVTREAASLIITDDNLATIVAGIEEGRATLCNVRRSLLYLLGTNLGEIILMLGASLRGLPLPLLPLQLLWINLLGDGLPALALGIIPPSPDVMEGPPEGQKSMLDRDFYRRTLRSGLASGLTSLYIFQRALRNSHLDHARTIALTALTGQQILYAFAHCPPHQLSRFMIFAGLLSTGLMGLTIAWPWARSVLHTTVPPARELAATLPVACLPPLLEKALGKTL